MIDVRNRIKTAFEEKIINSRLQLNSNVEIDMFDTNNYDYIVTSFYGEFILQDDSKIKTMNHFVKYDNYIYCFIEEIIENKYKTILWYSNDYSQKLHLKTVLEKHGDYYKLVDFASNIKEIDEELSVLKLIRIFGGYSEFLNGMECEKNPYLTIAHALLFKKFGLEIPDFDEYDDKYNKVKEYSNELRDNIIDHDLQTTTKMINNEL